MKRSVVIMTLLLAAGCIEPPKTGRMEQVVQGLAHIHTWHPRQYAKGQVAYDSVLNAGPDIIPVLVAHLTDETPTALFEHRSRRVPVIGDLCFLLLLQLTGIPWETFREDGVFIHTIIPNPVFSVKWEKPDSRYRAQARFMGLLEDPDCTP